MRSSNHAVNRWMELCLPGYKPGSVSVESRHQDWETLHIGSSILNEPLRIRGKEYRAGLGSHANSEVVLRAPLPMRRFRAKVGFDDNRHVREAAPSLGLIFSLQSGRREIWRSPALKFNAAPYAVDVALPPRTRELLLCIRTSNGEIARAHADWADAQVQLANGRWAPVGDPLAPPAPAPFSFQLGKEPSSELLARWPMSRKRSRSARGRTVHTVVWKQPGGGLECRLEMETFRGFPAVEWVVHFRNTGRKDTPVLSHIQALAWQAGTSGKPVLFRSRGSQCAINDFEYLGTSIATGETVRMAAAEGRSSSRWLPFFNLQTGGASGVITAIGWSGAWAAEFARKSAESLQITAGMEQTHLVLHPGEEIRSPRMLLLFWEGDRMASHNLLRQFVLAHHRPRPNGRPLQGPLTAAHWGGMKTAGHLARIAAFRRERFDYDYYWIDAGWYGPASSFSPDEHKGDWARHVGNWNVNPAAHPAGLRPISDAARKAGMKFLLWFEPERAISGTPWTVEHPDWFLGERKPGGNLLLDLGNPAARKFLTNFIVRFLKRNRIALYRQDFNFDTLPYWRNHDTKNRQGMTEIRHIEGLYAFWDALLKKCPGLVIDNCASGGRRIDLETIGRSIPLWRSDWQCFPDNDPIGGQVHGMGLSYWIPLHGTGAMYGRSPGDSTYRIRSGMGAAIQFSAFPYEYTELRNDYPWAWHRKMLREIRRAQPLFLGDYYPQTGGTPDPTQWATYQMHRADLGEGLLMLLRRPESSYSAATVRLQGLKPAARYRVECADCGDLGVYSGRQLLDNGVAVRMSGTPDSRLVFYREVRQKLR